MNSAKEAGFNAIRIAYSNAGLYTRITPNTQWPANPTFNSDLLDPSYPQPNSSGQYTFLPTFNILQKVVTYAGQLGLKIIFDQHQDEGNAFGNQPNGFWFDLDTSTGMNSDCSNYSNGQAAPNGTITYAHFKSDWVTFAQTFANNPTVIGFELHNEPSGSSFDYWEPKNCIPVPLNWGVTNNAYDIHYMAQDVGNAIGAANPNALVILEGDFENTPSTSSGMNPSVMGNPGDLTAVGGWGWNSSTPPNPVVLSIPHKMVYSVHHYPWEVSGIKPAGTGYGPTYVADWNNSWGYLVSQNIAPVLITEIGAFIESQDYRGNGSGTTSPDALAFMSAIVPYLNSQTGPIAGTVTGNGLAGPTTGNGNRQPVGFDWWAIGAGYSALCCGPNGIEIWAGTGDFNPDEIAYTDLLQFKGIKKITGDNWYEAASSNTAIGVGGTINDGNGNIWSITDNKVAVNGVVDTSTANVIGLAYINGKIWHHNSYGNWWAKTVPSDAWSPGSGTAVSPLQASPSTYLAVNGNSPIIDGSGNFWSIGSGMVLVNGVRDTTTANVIVMAYKNNLIYQGNNTGQWYSKSSPSGSWTAVSTSPLTPAPNNSVAFEGGASITDSSWSNWAIANGTVLVNGIADTTTTNVVELAYVGGRIYQMNTSRLWWSKASPSDTWTATGNGGQTRPGIVASANQAVSTWGGFGLTDSAGNDWSISGDSRVMNNGLIDQMTTNVVKLTMSAGKIWQQNASGSWFYKASISDIWHVSTTAPY